MVYSSAGLSTNSYGICAIARKKIKERYEIQGAQYFPSQEPQRTYQSRYAYDSRTGTEPESTRSSFQTVYDRNEDDEHAKLYNSTNCDDELKGGEGGVHSFVEVVDIMAEWRIVRPL